MASEMAREKDQRLSEAVRLRLAGDLPKACAVLLGLVAEYPADPVVNYQCAWIHDRLGLEREAVRYYEKALDSGLKGDDRAGAYLGLGSTLRGLGQYPKALAVLDSGVKEFPDHRPLRVFRAMALYNGKRGKESVSELLKILAETTADSEILAFKRAILFYAEDLDRVWEK
jgi:tetratricopeptide (TPR) repeat protein